MSEQKLNETPSANWTLIRDATLLQFKLIVDGLRDLLLVPLSIVAAIFSLVTGKDGQPGKQFYQLVHAGKQSELWIDLFGALKNAPPEIHEQKLPVDASLDDVVAYVESVVVKEHIEGSVTNKAKEHIDRALANIQSTQKRKAASE